jgi:hypothetical protein
VRVKLQLVLRTDDGCEETVTDIVTRQKDSQRIEYLGLTLAEAKQLLTTIQQCVLTHQVDAFLAAHAYATCSLSFPQPAVPRPSRQGPPETLPSPILSGMSRPRWALARPGGAPLWQAAARRRGRRQCRWRGWLRRAAVV